MSRDAPSARTPLLSFVLVVRREQAYVEECVASLLAHEHPDVEVVVIDDASADRAPALLDELAARDPRVRVEHLDRAAGVGAGRNRAIAAVRGEYVWFVDPTDVLQPGGLAIAADRLRTVAPDVLLVGHERIEPTGRRQQSPHGELLARLAEKDPVTLDRERALVDVAPRAWDKVLRTEFLRGLDVRFGAGGHSELSVTWPALLAARRIAAVPAAVYLRREPANAPGEDGSPFDVFAQYDAVFAFLDGREDVPPKRRDLLPPVVLRHERALFDQVAAGERRAFFERMTQGWRGGDAVAGRLPQLQARLVEGGRYTPFRALEGSLDTFHALEKRRAAADRTRRRVENTVRRRRMDRWYRSRLRRPLDPDLALFAAYWNRGYSCNPRAIYEKARELVPQMRGVWVVDRDAAASMPAGVEHVIAGSREYFDTVARASFLVNNVNFPNNVVKRTGAVHVMTHHGTPLKRMGLDVRMSDGATEALLRRCARWDFSVSSNPFSTLVWERVYPTRYETLEVGYPRNDALVNATDDDVRRIRADLDLAPEQTVVLYAPTHREYQPDEVSPLDVAALADGLGPDCVVLARRHYFYGSDPLLEGLNREGRVRDVASYPSVEELCLAADVLITDYSSIMFDYAVLDRPIVIHAADWEVYRAVRGTYFDLLAEPPGVVTRSEAEIVEAFASGAVWGDEARRDREAFRARFCSLEDGRAAERVVRRVFLGDRDAARPRAEVAR